MLIENICSKCGVKFERDKKSINYSLKNGFKLYCSKKCSNKSLTTGKFVSCFKCNKKTWRPPSQLKKVKNNRYYCTRSCAISINNTFSKPSNNNSPNIRTYRKVALKFYGTKCMGSDCLVSKIIDIPTNMLDVDHKDSNRNNNSIGNLQVLCVWCHALKTRNNKIKG